MVGIGTALRICLAGPVILLPACTAGPEPAPQQAARIDCPLREASYDLDTPLMDILMDPRAIEAVERAAPGFFGALPDELKRVTPPSLSAGYNIAVIANMKKMPDPVVQEIARELAALPLTDEIKAARCERYEVVPPEIEVAEGQIRILVFDKTNAHREVEAMAASEQMLQDLATENDWSVVRTNSGAAFTSEILRQFDVVIWDNVSGDVLTLSQRDAFRAYVEAGGGFVGLHGAGGNRFYAWHWYVNTLIGTQYIGHPHDPQIEEGTVRIEAGEDCLSNEVPDVWAVEDEWYAFVANPREAGARILATVDESSISTTGLFGADLSMGDDHPVIWAREVAQGRSFYSALGHAPQVYADPVYRRLVANGVRWAAGACPAAPEAPSALPQKLAPGDLAEE